jgi:hypothetical protein
VKIYVAPVKVVGLLGQNERQDETQFTTNEKEKVKTIYK